MPIWHSNSILAILVLSLLWYCGYDVMGPLHCLFMHATSLFIPYWSVGWNMCCRFVFFMMLSASHVFFLYSVIENLSKLSYIWSKLLLLLLPQMLCWQIEIYYFIVGSDGNNSVDNNLDIDAENLDYDCNNNSCSLSEE